MGYKDKAKQNEYQRKWMANRRAEWLAKNGPCKRCGTWDNLEINHVDRSTKVTHNVWSLSKQRRDNELAKCQILCHSCHLTKSLETGDIKTVNEHGTSQMYNKGCRCEKCRKRATERVREWRARKKIRNI